MYFRIHKKTKVIVVCLSSVFIFLLTSIHIVTTGLPLSRLNMESFQALFAVRAYQAFHAPADTDNTNRHNSVPVLLYHGLNSSKSKSSTGYDLSIRSFADQMLELKKEGFSTISIQQFVNHQQKNSPLPPKPILITFDDGIKDSYVYSQPILSALKYRATMFVITEDSVRSSNTYYLNTGQIKAMSQSGVWDIQTHAGKGHKLIPVDKAGSKGSFYANTEWLGDIKRAESIDEYRLRVKNDFTEANNQIKNITGIAPTAIAYPFGDNGYESKNIDHGEQEVYQISQKYFKYGFIQWWPSRGYSQSSPSHNQFYIKRMTVLPHTYLTDFKTLINQGADLNLPFRSDTANNVHWVSFSGTLQSKHDQLLIVTKNQAHDVGAFLDGSNTWKNYIVNANLHLIKGESASLITRYVDSNNYLSCNFTNDKIIIRKKTNGYDQIVQTYPMAVDINAPHKVRASIVDNNIECNLDGFVGLYSLPLSNNHNMGGIAITADSLSKDVRVEFTGIRAVPHK